MSPAIRLASLCAAVAFLAVSCSVEPEIAINNDLGAAGVQATDSGISSSAEGDASATPSRDANGGDTATTHSGSGECNYLGTDSWNDMQIEVAFQNEQPNVSDIRVAYSVINSSGEVIHDASTTIERVNPDEALRWHIDTLDEPETSDTGYDCTVDSITVRENVESVVLPAAGDSCRFVELDSFDDIQIEIEFTAPSDEPLLVSYALRSSDGTRFEGGYAAPDPATAAGDVVTYNEDTVADVPEWLTGDISCEILGITES